MVNFDVLCFFFFFFFFFSVIILFFFFTSHLFSVLFPLFSVTLLSHCIEQHKEERGESAIHSLPLFILLFIILVVEAT